MVKKLVTSLIVVALGFGLVVSGGCESSSDAQKGAGLGALVGAGVGAIVGHQSGNTAEGALAGAAVGGGVGYMAGNESDKEKTQAEIDSLRAEQNVVTVWITNSNGSKIPIRLKRSGPNYIGPKGDYYDHLPTEDELRPVYGF
ncbi:MAG: glycine zipper domain-containing protein [Planctomycetota bacterium]|jgi:uncharacterized protein YcfJ